MLAPLMHVLSQIPSSALGGDEPRLEESSSILTLLLGAGFAVLVFLMAMKTSKRNHMQT